MIPLVKFLKMERLYFPFQIMLAIKWNNNVFSVSSLQNNITVITAPTLTPAEWLQKSVIAWLCFRWSEENDNFASLFSIALIWIEEIRNVCSIDENALNRKGKITSLWSFPFPWFSSWCFCPVGSRCQRLIQNITQYQLPTPLTIFISVFAAWCYRQQ